MAKLTIHSLLSPHHSSSSSSPPTHTHLVGEEYQELVSGVILGNLEVILSLVVASMKASFLTTTGCCR